MRIEPDHFGSLLASLERRESVSIFPSKETEIQLLRCRADGKETLLEVGDVRFGCSMDLLLDHWEPVEK